MEEEIAIWSEAETDILISLAPIKTVKEIAEILKNKTERQIKRHARNLKIEVITGKSILWTEAETKFLLENYDKFYIQNLANMMERATLTIENKAKELGIKLKRKKPTQWSFEEIEMLKKYASICTEKELTIIINRSRGSISAKLHKLNLQAASSSYFWTMEETRDLINLAKNHSIEEIAKILNKSYEVIYSKLQVLNIKAETKAKRYWTLEECDLLLTLITSFSIKEISTIMNRSEYAIETKAKRLNLNSSRTLNYSFNDYELKRLAETMNIKELAKYFNRTCSEIWNHLITLNIVESENCNLKFSLEEISLILKVPKGFILTEWIDKGLIIEFDRNTYEAYVTYKRLIEFLKENYILEINAEEYLKIKIKERILEILKYKLNQDEVSNSKIKTK